MRGDREHVAPLRGAFWRRCAATLLAALLALNSALALAESGTAFADSEFCRSQPESSGDGTGERDRRHQTCLLCLPGCSALAACDGAFAIGPSPFAVAGLVFPGTRLIRAARGHAPYRPRGPPA